MNEAQHQENEQTLLRVNLDDMLISLGLEKIHFGRKWIEALFYYPARQFARQVLDYDNGVAALGLAGGSKRLLDTYVNSLTIHGQENFPKNGPALILSNHPGMTDTVALFASLPRADLRVLAAERPFLRALPATCQHLVFVPEETMGRGEVIRKTAQHLRSGGAILTFPAGKIEPDPLVLPGAVQSLEEWSNSIGVFVRLAPDAVIIPVFVRGVIASQAIHHPLTRLRRKPKDQERLGATLQILAKVFFPKIWPVDVQVHIFPSIKGKDLAGLHDPDQITQAVIEQIRPMLASISRITTD